MSNSVKDIGLKNRTSVSRSVGQSVSLSVGRLVGRSVGRSVGWLVERSVGRSVSQSAMYKEKIIQNHMFVFKS